jgi:outer membrane protein
VRKNPILGPLLLALFCVSIAPCPAPSQQVIPGDLSLAEAIRIARQSNPGFLSARNNEGVADWTVRAAYGSLIPTASASSGLSWQGSGEQRFGSVTLGQLGFADQPDYFFSSFNFGLSYALDGRTFLALPQAKISRQATRAEIRTADADLAFRVTQSYLEVLRQEEGRLLTGQELERAELNLRLARGQMEVGSGTPMDTRQAEVARGRAQVAVLQAENATSTAKIRLLQLMGVEPSEDFQLSTQFALVDPSWTEEGLYELALAGNPLLENLRANRRVSSYQVRMAKSSYFPSLSLSAGISGFTQAASNTDLLMAQAQQSALSQIAQCEALNDLYQRLADPLPTSDCSVYQFTEAQRRLLEKNNDAFPFNFTRQPPSASLVVSIPIFKGLRRQQEVESAKAQEEDLRFQVREQELALKADIAAGLATLRTAHEAALIEDQNQVWADEQLRLAQERYRLGFATFLELVEAETVKAQADRDRITAIFAYHDALSSLEAVVGSPLRTP